MEADARAQGVESKASSLERELCSALDTIGKKERMMTEEKHRFQEERASMEEIRAMLERDCEKVSATK